MQVTSIDDTYNEIFKKYAEEMSENQMTALADRVRNLTKNDLPHSYSIYNLHPSTEIKTNIFNNVISQIVFSASSPWKPSFVPKSPRQKLILDTICGKPPSFEELKNDSALLTSIFLWQDPAVFKEARELLQDIFDDMAAKFCQQEIHPMKSSDIFHLEMIIGDFLALYPFFAPLDDETISIPIFELGEWHYPKYKVMQIELTGSLFGTPIVAYGLRPISLKRIAAPLLLFKGTTYPADSGAAKSILTDIFPFTSVGENVFNDGKYNIERWLKFYAKKKKAILFGKSLGGCQSWRSALHFPDYIKKVMAYSAPGFSAEEKELCLQLHRLGHLPRMNFFCQANDPAPYSDLGCEEGVNYYEVISSSMQENPLLAHADMYSTHEYSSILILDPKAMTDHERRQLVTTIRKICGLLYPIIALAQVCRSIIYPEILHNALFSCINQCGR